MLKNELNKSQNGKKNTLHEAGCFYILINIYFIVLKFVIKLEYF